MEHIKNFIPCDLTALVKQIAVLDFPRFFFGYQGTQPDGMVFYGNVGFFCFIKGGAQQIITVSIFSIVCKLYNIFDDTYADGFAVYDIFLLKQGYPSV